MAADNNTLDAALAQVHGYSCVLTNNLSNHIPMVAEALNHMGLADAMLPWVTRAMAFCRTKPPLRQVITPDAWQTALAMPRVA